MDSYNIFEPKKYLFAFSVIVLAIVVFIPGPAQSAQTIITAAKADQAPDIDGAGDDAAWQAAKAFTVRDQVGDVDIVLKAVYTGEDIFFLINFPDQREDRYHKPWVWNKDLETYQLGPQREDTFAFKWNMTDKDVDLSNFSDDDYTADVWYWKADRTDPAGHADDKTHILSSEAAKKAAETTSKTGKKRYLLRLGDEGQSAEEIVVATDYAGDLLAQYKARQPDGSRADIKAKGLWKENGWTIELGRKLNTGHGDDVQFDTASGKKYLFGVSIYGLYGEPVDKNKEYLYGQGRISDKLYLVFE